MKVIIGLFALFLLMGCIGTAPIDSLTINKPNKNLQPILVFEGDTTGWGGSSESVHLVIDKEDIPIEVHKWNTSNTRIFALIDVCSNQDINGVLTVFNRRYPDWSMTTANIYWDGACENK